ncbi:MAG: hypothetical protein Q9225_001724 [Loekoesia sp. 1 TL-2023]
MAFAPPAVRANFLYNGDLYVDVGNFNRNKRASVAEITEILRPDLKKPKNGVPVKDPVGHWYEAQLIHYGLPPSKDKARAKMRLLENLNNSNLKVPHNIAAIESELKKEFAAAERKAKAQHKASMAAKESAPAKPAQSKKRKDPENEVHVPSVNVNINLGAIASPTHGDPTPKKRKLQTARRGKQSGPSSELSHAAPQESAASNDTPAMGSPKPRQYATTQTARRSRPFPGPRPPPVSHSDMKTSTPYSFQSDEPPIVLDDNLESSQPKKGTKPKKEQKLAVKKEAKVKRESVVKKEPKVKTEPNTKRKTAAPSTSPSAAPSLGLINGIYDISCPTIEEEWGCDNLTLILTLDTPGVWGAYDFGVFSGIFHIPQRPYSAPDRVELYWRGRENGEGEMSFGEDCNGVLSFLGNGRVEGWMNLYGDCHFEGVRRDGPGAPIRTARSMREEWEGSMMMSMSERGEEDGLVDGDKGSKLRIKTLFGKDHCLCPTARCVSIVCTLGLFENLNVLL